MGVFAYLTHISRDLTKVCVTICIRLAGELHLGTIGSFVIIFVNQRAVNSIAVNTLTRAGGKHVNKGRKSTRQQGQEVNTSTRAGSKHSNKGRK